MKIAIIGASSFVGKNLILLLIKKKIEVVATYNKSKKKLIKSKFIEWKKLDISLNKINHYKFLGNPDVVINLAWRDIPNYLSKSHLKTYVFQKRFNKNLIKNGLQNLIVLGTCYEYGNVKGKISENFNCRPTIPYSIAKLKLLKSILILKKKYEFKFTWLRPFFVYGFNEKRKTLYSIIKEIDKGKKIKINVCGKLIRDFLSVNYLVNIIIKILKLNKDVGILNVCSGKKTTIRNFIKKNLRNKNKINDINMNAKNPNFFEPKFFWGSTKKLRKILKSKNEKKKLFN